MDSLSYPTSIKDWLMRLQTSFLTQSIDIVLDTFLQIGRRFMDSQSTKIISGQLHTASLKVIISSTYTLWKCSMEKHTRTCWKQNRRHGVERFSVHMHDARMCVTTSQKATTEQLGKLVSCHWLTCSRRLGGLQWSVTLGGVTKQVVVPLHFHQTSWRFLSKTGKKVNSARSFRAVKAYMKSLSLTVATWYVFHNSIVLVIDGTSREYLAITLFMSSMSITRNLQSE